MLQPALEPLVRSAVNLVQVAIWPSTGVPVRVQRLPTIRVVVGLVVEVFVIGYVKRPAIVGIEKHIVLHWQALARNRGNIRDDGLEGGTMVFYGGPLSDSLVAAAI